MICPHCNHPQSCPCKACQETNPTDLPWQWNGEFIACGNCGIEHHCDWWMDEEAKQLKKETGYEHTTR